MELNLFSVNMSDDCSNKDCVEEKVIFRSELCKAMTEWLKILILYFQSNVVSKLL